MEPYEDENCKCHEIEKEIDKKYPDANWNLDEACEEWGNRSVEIEDNDIEFSSYPLECYGCTCSACGRRICGLCV